MEATAAARSRVPAVLGADTRLVIEGHAARVVLREAIRSRLEDRAWYRAHPFTLDWPTRLENEILLRELVRLGRRTQAMSRSAASVGSIR